MGTVARLLAENVTSPCTSVDRIDHPWLYPGALRWRGAHWRQPTAEASHDTVPEGWSRSSENRPVREPMRAA